MENIQDRMILVEGLDLAGKSTLCQGLADRLGQLGYVVSITKNNLLGQNVVGRLAKQYAVTSHTTKVETGALFLASHFYDTTLFEPLEPGHVHLQDSSWLRTISYHTMKETPIIPSLAEALFKAHPSFGTVLYLTANLEVRRARLMSRESAKHGSGTPGDFLSFTDSDFVIQHDRKLIEITRRFYPQVEVIDTSFLSLENVIEMGWTILNQKLR